MILYSKLPWIDSGISIVALRVLQFIVLLWLVLIEKMLRFVVLFTQFGYTGILVISE